MRNWNIYKVTFVTTKVTIIHLLTLTMKNSVKYWVPRVHYDFNDISSGCSPRLYSLKISLAYESQRFIQCSFSILYHIVQHFNASSVQWVQHTLDTLIYAFTAAPRRLYYITRRCLNQKPETLCLWGIHFTESLFHLDLTCQHSPFNPVIAR